MGKLWAKLFGSSDNVGKGLDMLRDGVDMAVFTPEERSITGRKIIEARISLLKALGPQSKARRYITYLVVGLWTYLIVLMVHLHLFGYKLQAEYIFKVLTDVIGVPFAIIMAFYYAANIVRARK